MDGVRRHHQPAGSWESDQALVTFARRRLREAEKDTDQTGARPFIHAAQEAVEDFVDLRREAARRGLDDQESLQGTETWGVRRAVIRLLAPWREHSDYRDEWGA